MASETAIRAFFGDAEREFSLSATLIVELERVTEAGIGTLFNRLSKSEFRHADIVETIRLGLIGGGTDPQEAANLIATYVASRPLAGPYTLALSVLQGLWIGSGEAAS